VITLFVWCAQQLRSGLDASQGLQTAGKNVDSYSFPFCIFSFYSLKMQVITFDF